MGMKYINTPKDKKNETGETIDTIIRAYYYNDAEGPGPRQRTNW
jgi:hypothetical protein